MRDLAIALALATALAGCNAVAVPQYGDFSPRYVMSVNMNESLVTDTVTQLMALYPAASTQFDVSHATPDPFGTRLVQSLRQKGYALGELANAETSAGLSLRYILDAPERNLFRVTVLVGSQSLSRAYLHNDGALLPAGAWTRKE